MVLQAIQHVEKRDKQNIERYMKHYGIDILNHENFDLVINSEKFGIDECASIIIAAVKGVR